MESAWVNPSVGGTDAEVAFVGSADGTYEIRANSYDADEVGGYVLTLEDEGVVDEPDEPEPEPEPRERREPRVLGEPVQPPPTDSARAGAGGSG